MVSLRELLRERDRLKNEGSLFTTGGVGAALVGALLITPALAGPIAAAASVAGAYGVLKGRSGDNRNIDIGSAIQEEFERVCRQKPELGDAVIQVLVLLTDAQGKPVRCDFERLSIGTKLETEKLKETIESLLASSLIVKVSNTQNTYTVHELIARFISNKLQHKFKNHDLPIKDESSF